MESQQNTGCGCGGNRMSSGLVKPPQTLTKSQTELAALINAVHMRKSKISKVRLQEKQ
jgi:hypothetical protein